MRILLVTPMPPRREAPGAIPLTLYGELEGLRSRHDVTLVTVAGDEPGEVDAAVDLRRSGLDVHVIDGRRPLGVARWHRRWRLASTWARGRYPWRTIWFADPRVQETLDLLARTHEFDIAAVEDNSMGGFRLPPGVATVLTEHEVRRSRTIDRRLGPPSDWPRWALHEADRRRWPAYQRSVWRRFDRIQVFSERDANGIGELAPEVVERVRVNPFGIVLPECADPAREEPQLVLFVGNFTHPPNVDAALWLAREIMPLLRAQSEGVRLQLIGGGAPEALRVLTAPDLEVIGEVPAIFPYVEAATVVLAPIRTGGGMRMKVLYALAAGKAVVTTHLGAEGLAFDSREPPLAVAEDADAIATATARLLRDGDLRRTLAGRARAFAVEHHSAEAYARRLEAVYEDAVAERRGALLAAAGH